MSLEHKILVAILEEFSTRKRHDIADSVEDQKIIQEIVDRLGGITANLLHENNSKEEDE